MENKILTTHSSPTLKRIRALLIDDERGALNTLQTMLTAYCPEVETVGVALTVSDAVRYARKNQPDLVFLDVEMPPLGSGFDFLKQCKDPSFGVIFVTAYPQYAVKAINTIQPWAYLVKPYNVRELISAVEIASEKIGALAMPEFQDGMKKRIIVQDRRKGSIVLKASEIIFCKADGSFTDFVTYQASKIVVVTSSRYLGEIEEELPSDIFFRSHHSYIVNMNFMDRFERTGRNGIIHLRYSQEEVQISVSKMDMFLKRLDQNNYEG
jgi:two-component system LytT family response regulator